MVIGFTGRIISNREFYRKLPTAEDGGAFEEYKRAKGKLRRLLVKLEGKIKMACTNS